MSKTILISGVVSEGDAYRVEYRGKQGAIYIGQVDVIGSLSGQFPRKQKVTVGIMNAEFKGELFIETGWGYSEYTPMDSDEWKVGEHNMISILSGFIGKEVTLIVSDEPVNLLDLKEQ